MAETIAWRNEVMRLLIGVYERQQNIQPGAFGNVGIGRPTAPGMGAFGGNELG